MTNRLGGDTGAVFTFGRSRFADNEPSHFFIKNDPIVAISCGDEHSAVICHNGRVFVFGGNAWGQLGLGHKDEVSRPSCVKWLKPHRALFVACGRAHTVFVTDTHAIYTVGCNDEGQLGTGDMENHTVPQYVELDSEDSQVKQVSAGSNHTAILTDSGKVFVCGSNTEGQLGLGEEVRISLKFTELKFMEKISFVECGYYHTVFITADGAVFVTGDNEGQKLGTTKLAEKLYVPEVLPIDTPIKGACCGASHTFLLSMDESKIFAFGSNEKGQLGMPRQMEYVTVPTEIEMDKMFEGFQLKLVACGAMHTAFVTDNGLLYTCGESRHNKLCLEEVDDVDNSNDVPNQYLPKRVTAMNGYVVDNVACGGCHTLLTAVKGSNSDFTNNDFSVLPEQTNQIPLAELPPLQKIPGTVMNKTTNNESPNIQDIENSNIEDKNTTDILNGNEEDNASIDSLEANVSGSHIMNINDLETESVNGLPELNKDDDDITKEATDLMKKTLNPVLKNNNPIEIINKLKTEVQTTIETGAKEVKKKIEIIEETITKKMDFIDPGHKCEEIRSLGVPEKIDEVRNSPPPKSPILQELLHVPDIVSLSPENSRHSDDGQKSECGSRSENETLPCGSDKSSPQIGKIAKTQAVLPIVRKEDLMDSATEHNIQNEDSEVVVQKLPEKGRFSKMFQSIRDKENSCMGKGKVIEDTVTENVHKGIATMEETVHKVEETVETEIRNQTNSRTCTLL